MELSINTFLVLLFASCTLTALFTQGVKVLLGDRIYSVNLVAAAMSVIVTTVFSIGVCVFNEVVIDSKYIVFFIALIAFTWLGSMIGYDKIKQCISQLVAAKRNKNN